MIGVLTREALQSFNSARLETLYGLYGMPMDYIADPFANPLPPPIRILGCRSSIRNNKELRDGGFALEHDFIVRVRQSGLKVRPKVEGRLVVGPITYRIAEVIDSAYSGEWKLGLQAAV